MRSVLLLCNKRLKNNPLDRAVKNWAEKNGHKSQMLLSSNINKAAIKPILVIPRQTLANTKPFENLEGTKVINHFENRIRAKNKLVLDRTLTIMEILTPYTIPFTKAEKVIKALKFPVLLKPSFGAMSNGIVELSNAKELSDGKLYKYLGPDEEVRKHYMIQEKIDGDLYKVYGPYRKKWIAIHKQTLKQSFVPAKMSKACQGILEEYDLDYAGMDFIVNEKGWYLVDLNTTTGLKSMSEGMCQKFVNNLLKPYQGDPRTKYSACGIVIRDFGGVLKVALVLDPKKAKAKAHKDGAGWVVPGGHIHPGETKQDAALREIREESGLKDIKLLSMVGEITKPSHDDDGKRIFKNKYYFVGYLLGNPDAVPHIDDKHTETKWFTMKEAMRKCYYKNEAELIKKVLG